MTVGRVGTPYQSAGDRVMLSAWEAASSGMEETARHFVERFGPRTCSQTLCLLQTTRRMW